MVKKIILVFKTHFDIGFTDLAENVIQSYGSKMLQEVIETCNATADLGKLRYVWTMPAWPLWYICQNCDPQLKPELDRLIQEGQIVWHGLPFTSHTDVSAPEEYAQTLRYSKELAKWYGKPLPVSAKMTDVPGHGLMLPEILDQAGIRFLHLGCNEFATPPDVPSLFFWQGPGGGKVLTMYSKGGYGTGLLPPEDWPYPVWMALMHTHDNCGPQSAEIIMKMARKAQAAYPDAEIVCGTMDDFYREMEHCDLSDVPVIQKDLADTWIHGVSSYPAEVSLLRECRERSRALHRRYFARLVSGKADIPGLQEIWNQYYDAVALFTEHTWGADVKTWLGSDRVYEKDEFLAAKHMPSYRFMEKSWQEQRNRAEQAKECLDRIEDLLGHEEKAASVIAEPPLRIRNDENALIVENHRYRINLDCDTGMIRSLYDLTHDSVIMEAGEEGIFSYRYDRYGLPDVTEFLRSYGYHFTTWGIQDYGRENYPDCSREVYYPRFQGWKVEGRELHLSYLSGKSSTDYGDGRFMELILTFPCRGDELYITFAIEQKQETPFIESGSLVFPFVGKVSYQIGKPGGVVDPENQIQDCANHALFNLERQVTVLTEQGCVSICSLDAPLFGIGSPGVYEYHKDFGNNRKPTLYFDLFNNMWGTNFPQWIGGKLCYRFVLSAGTHHDAENASTWAAKIVCPAAETMSEGVMLPKGMELLHTCHEGKAIYITLRDLTGVTETRKLCVPGAEIQSTDLLHHGTSKAHRNTYVFQVRPYGLHIFQLTKNTD